MSFPSYISASDMIFGNLLNFNQILINGNFSSQGNWAFNSSAYGSYTIENNIGYIKIGSSGEGNSSVYFNNYAFRQIIDHIYLISLDIKSERNNEIRYGYPSILTPTKTSELVPNEWSKYQCIVKALYTVNNALLYLNVNRVLMENDIVEIKNYQIFDLTQMFGENIANCIFSAELANDGCGINIFNFIMPKDYYDYTPGQQKQIALIDVNG